MRTISLRPPVAHALLAEGCGIVGKKHRLPDTELGLHCSRQKGPQGGRNDEMQADLARLGLVPPDMSKVASLPIGHVFARAKVLGRATIGGTIKEVKQRVETALVIATANGLGHYHGLTNERLEKWLRYWLFSTSVESPELYLLADIRLVRPFPWQGKMSCFPVPDAAFKAMPKVSR